jgi:hypothetical protein
MNPTLPLAVFSAFDIGLLFGLGGMFVGLVFGLAAMYFDYRRRALWHQTARLALEKGQPLPAEFGKAEPANSYHSSSASDTRNGLISIGVGAGLYLFFDGMGPESLRYVGAIPAFVGIAMLLFGLLSGARKKKKE